MRPNAQETADLVTFTEEILYGKHHFFCAVDNFFHSLPQFLSKLEARS